MRAFIALWVFISAVKASAFTMPSSQEQHKSRLGPKFMFFADSAAVEEVKTESANTDIQIVTGSESSIDNAAKFMVDSFWLQSPQQLIQNTESSQEVSDAAKTSLTKIQADDLMSKYGERMGARKLDAIILAAMDGEDDTTNNDNGVELLATDNVKGLVTIEVRLLDSQRDILSAKESEYMLTQAVASLGPKQRREYKDASVLDIANQLLSPDITAVCSLSNLCVSPLARRQGIAAKLCNEAERLAKEKLGFDDIHLRVEVANEAAKKLYEEKLGYEAVFNIDSATVLRVDRDSGSFVEIESDIVVLKKTISS